MVTSESQLLAYGYRCTDLALETIPPVDPSLKFSCIRQSDKNVRPPVRISTGLHWDGNAMPQPDGSDTETLIAGVRKRVGTYTPVPVKNVLDEFRQFNRKWLRENLIPLAPDTDLGFETFLEATNYPLWKKEVLRQVQAQIVHIEGNPKYFKLKSFCKAETYPKFKHMRGINSRSDEFKCWSGPVFKCIEKELFKHPAFIKKVPIDERPEYIYNRIFREGAQYIATDYTSFEASFVTDLMEACEFELYDYMTSNLACHDDFMRVIRGVLGGTNECQFKYFKVEVAGKRMSGEMCTSLGNGFTNLMAMLFTCQRNGNTGVAGVVEGDDGLFTMVGSPPTTEMFAELGLVMKLELHDRLEEASFCGIVFSSEDKKNITNPLEVLADFGWAGRDYVCSSKGTKLALLRCKALSFAHQYKGCPIIGRLAECALRLTSHVKINKILESKSLAQWDREQLLEAIKSDNNTLYEEPGFATRVLVERLYGITTRDQLVIERYFMDKTDLSPISCPTLDNYSNSVWRQYWTLYVRPAVGDIRRSVGGFMTHSGLQPQFDSKGRTLKERDVVGSNCGA